MSEPAVQPVTDSLDLVALETERHVAASGWDQNPRLFALVASADLLEREPHLRAGASLEDVLPGALTAIEQEGLPPTSDLESMLARIAWPESVLGAALAVERIIVPPDAEHDLPAGKDQAVDALAAHPDRRDVRLLVAVHRDGRATCLLRQRDHDRDDRVARGENIAPGLVHALRMTFED